MFLTLKYSPLRGTAPLSNPGGPSLGSKLFRGDGLTYKQLSQEAVTSSPPAQKQDQCSGRSNPLSFLGLSFHFCKMEGGGTLPK